MSITVKISWKFPEKDFSFMKIEILFVSIIALLVFLFTWSGYNSWYLAALFSVLFIGIYILTSFVIQKWRIIEEKYKLTPTYLEVTRKKRNKTKKEKIPLKNIIHHSLDKIFLGGYLLTKNNKKHQLFFNKKEEIEMFEKLIKKFLKKK